jgi:HEAT repeat protein
MPLIRTAVAASGTLLAEQIEPRVDPSAANDATARRRAARALSGDPGAASTLAARLDSERDPGVREALFNSLVAIGGTRTAEVLARLLRHADAGLRGGAIEALKQLGDDAVPALDILLGDADPDVRLLAVEVTRAWPCALAVPRLARIIESDPHVNVCGAAVDVATEVGTGELVPALARLRARFPREAFLLFAVDIACARIDGNDGRSG